MQQFRRMVSLSFLIFLAYCRLFVTSFQVQPWTKHGLTWKPQPRSKKAITFVTRQGKKTELGAAERDITHEVCIVLTYPSDLDGSRVIPLPSSHLPDELGLLNLYFWKPPAVNITTSDGWQNCFGHICSSSVSVGSIGCASELLAKSKKWTYPGDTPATIFCTSSFRFIVRKVIQDNPFPIVLVEQLHDELPRSTQSLATHTKTETESNYNYDDDDGDDDDDDEEEEDDNDDNDKGTDDEDTFDEDRIDDLSPQQLMGRLGSAMSDYCQHQLEEHESLSRSEEAALKELHLPKETMTFVPTIKCILWDDFLTQMDDLYPSPVLKYYAMGMMAATLADYSFERRCKILQMTDGVKRLRYVLRNIEETNGIARARKVMMKQMITDAVVSKGRGASSEIPSWLKSLRKGKEVEYYWDKEYGWCRGRLVELPVTKANGIMFKIHFDKFNNYFDDGSCLLFWRASEKGRWRRAPE